MIKHIRKYAAQFKDKNFIVLWFESVLFSVVFAAAYRSWLVFAVMVLGLSWILSRPKGVVYMTFILSFLWGFIAFSIGYEISWGWAAALGGSFCLLGIKVHLAGLKKPVAAKSVSVHQSNIEWRRNGYLGRQNLN